MSRTGRPRLKLPENTIINKYISGLNTIELGKIYNVSGALISNILSRNNIKTREQTDIGRIYSGLKLNENIFDIIDSHEKAYWLGFLATDGGVYKNAISLHLAIKDIDHLQKFKTFMECDHKISVKKRKHDSCRIRFKSKKLRIRLAELGIVQNKTFILKFAENIPNEFLNSYILGLIDGDGSFCISKYSNTLTFSIVSASEQFIVSLQKSLIKNCNLNKTKLTKVKNKFILNYAGTKQVSRIVKYIYVNNTSHLERKKKIAITHIQKMGYII